MRRCCFSDIFTLRRNMASDSVSDVSESRWVRGSSVNERKFIRELAKINLRGFLGDTERKNMEAMALELRGPEAVRGLQRLLNQYQCAGRGSSPETP